MNDFERVESMAIDCIGEKDYEGALEIYDEALSKEPTSELMLRSKAYVLKKLERYREALEIYNNILFIKPESEEVMARKAGVIKEIDGHKSALRYLNESIGILTKNKKPVAELYREMAFVRFDEGGFWNNVRGFKNLRKSSSLRTARIPKTKPGYMMTNKELSKNE